MIKTAYQKKTKPRNSKLRYLEVYKTYFNSSVIEWKDGNNLSNRYSYLPSNLVQVLHWKLIKDQHQMVQYKLYFVV